MSNTNEFPEGFIRNSGTSAQAIQDASKALHSELPNDNVAFLRETNGGEGWIGENYVILWKTEELAGMNESYQVAEYTPGLLLIGSNGGGDAYGFDTRNTPCPVVKMPFVGMGLPDAEVIAPSFTVFSTITGTTIKQGRKELAGKEIFEIKPVIIGGSPTDPANKTLLDRAQHIEVVRYWNRIIRDLRQAQGKK